MNEELKLLAISEGWGIANMRTVSSDAKFPYALCSPFGRSFVDGQLLEPINAIQCRETEERAWEDLPKTSDEIIKYSRRGDWR